VAVACDKPPKEERKRRTKRKSIYTWFIVGYLYVGSLYVLTNTSLLEILRRLFWWYLKFLVWYRKISGRVDFEAVRSYHKMRSKENGS